MLWCDYIYATQAYRFNTTHEMIAYDIGAAR
jgi:hypothetical protein